MSVPVNTKSDAAQTSCGRCGGYVGGKLIPLPGEILQAAKICCSNNELQEVSRDHSTGGIREGSNNRKILSKDLKVVGVLKAEYLENKGFLWKDSWNTKDTQKRGAPTAVREKKEFGARILHLCG